MPLTGDAWWGFLLRVIRRGKDYEAPSIGGVGIYPCIGGRPEVLIQHAAPTIDPRGRS
jgi:protein-L-isoaspartate(D-aspartate) O-methyltransferase